MEDESWAADVSAEVVAYARELAISPEQVAHWVSFLTQHPQGQLAWEEIRRVWKPARRRRSGAGPAPAPTRPSRS